MAGWDGISLDLPEVLGSVSGNLIFDNLLSNPAPIVTAVGNINLDASSYISQDSSSAAIITQHTLTANAVDGISLDGDNQVRTFRATNTGTGDIDFYNVGDVAFDNISNQAIGGYVWVESEGGIAQFGNIDTDGGDITVYATNDIDMDPYGVRSATINNSTNLNSIYYESTEGNVKIGLLDAGLGSVGVTAGLNIIDTNGFSNNIVASSAGLNAGVRYFGGQGNIEVDTQITGDPMMQEGLDIDNSDANSTSVIKIRNTGSPLLVNAYSSDYTDTLEITNNSSIHIGHIEGAVDTTITATGTSSDIEINANLYAPAGGTLLSEGNVTLDAGRDILINDDYISAGGSVSATARTGNITLTNSYIDAWGSVTANANGATPGNGNITLDADTSPTYISAGTGMSLTAVGVISLNATDSYAQLIANNGEQSITATAIDLRAGNAAFGAYAEIEHAGSGDQIVHVGTLTLTGGETGDNNYARIENSSAVGIQKIGTNANRPIINMYGGDSGGAYNSSPIVTFLVSPGTNGSSDGSNSAEINSEGRQEIYAHTITMNAGDGFYAGAIISAPNQQITTTSHVTLNGGSSNSPTSPDDQFDYNGVTYDLASPAAIGDKDTLNQKLNIGGILTLTAGSGSSGLAMVGSLNGVATNNITTNSRGSITADSIMLNSGNAVSLALLGGVEDIIVANTFTNIGGAITDNSSGSNPWSIWAPNPAAISGCGSGTGCLADFAQYGLTYGLTANPALGHGLLYSTNPPALTSTMTGAVSKPYDGNTTISLLGAIFGSISGQSYYDDITLASISGGTGVLDNPNEGTGKLVTASGMQVTGVRSDSLTGSIPVYGYSVASASAYIGTVSAAVVTDDVQDVITAINNGSETTSSEQDNQTKQEEDEIKAPEKVLVALNFVDDPKANNENPVETEKPKGRTLQCSVSK